MMMMKLMKKNSDMTCLINFDVQLTLFDAPYLKEMFIFIDKN